MKQYTWLKGSHQLRVGRRSCGGRIYFVTTHTQHRKPIFLEENYARAAMGIFTSPALLKDNDLLCWVLMPDHVHWLIQLGNTSTLSAFISTLKSASARQVRRAGYSQSVWHNGFHDRRLKHNLDISVVTRYILNNPVKAGLVERVEDYAYRG